MLVEAVASVAHQTRQPDAHLISVDHARVGEARNRTRLVQAASTTWVAFLDDDDLLDPHHLETLLGRSDGADIVYSWCRVEGVEDWLPNRLFDAEALEQGNYIPVTVLARRDAILDVGGFPDRDGSTWPDYGLWLRLLKAGATFRCVPQVTWTYRLHPGSDTWGNFR